MRQGIRENAAPRRVRAFHARVLLMKPRVMSLVVLTGAVGYLLAPLPLDAMNFIAAMSAMAAAAGACGALNMWWDADIDAKIADAVQRDGALDMSAWHTCETTHCRAGWAIHLAGEAGKALERAVGSCAAGALIYAVSRPDKPVPDFYGANEMAMKSILKDAGKGA